MVFPVYGNASERALRDAGYAKTPKSCSERISILTFLKFWHPKRAKTVSWKTEIARIRLELAEPPLNALPVTVEMSLRRVGETSQSALIKRIGDLQPPARRF